VEQAGGRPQKPELNLLALGVGEAPEGKIHPPAQSRGTMAGCSRSRTYRNNARAPVEFRADLGRWTPNLRRL